MQRLNQVHQQEAALQNREEVHGPVGLDLRHQVLTDYLVEVPVPNPNLPGG
ncbi:hypothetical protein [Marinobacter alexandrii]|uniref:hypothetical protein n=1 Tax=Marinobacter alexandrii TaxID=2570351 RepID=UPI0032996515